jgi:hypothetical protein
LVLNHVLLIELVLHNAHLSNCPLHHAPPVEHALVSAAVRNPCHIFYPSLQRASWDHRLSRQSPEWKIFTRPGLRGFPSPSVAGSGALLLSKYLRATSPGHSQSHLARRCCVPDFAPKKKKGSLVLFLSRVPGAGRVSCVVARSPLLPPPLAAYLSRASFCDGSYSSNSSPFLLFLLPLKTPPRNPSSRHPSSNHKPHHTGPATKPFHNTV